MNVFFIFQKYKSRIECIYFYGPKQLFKNILDIFRKPILTVLLICILEQAFSYINRNIKNTFWNKGTGSVNFWDLFYN